MNNNWKNELQEYCQKKGVRLPEYDFSSKGADHLKKFIVTVIVTIDTQTLKFTGDWFNKKKEAEQDAARKALEYYKPKVGLPDHTGSSSLQEVVYNLESLKIDKQVFSEAYYPPLIAQNYKTISKPIAK